MGRKRKALLFATLGLLVLMVGGAGGMYAALKHYGILNFLKNFSVTIVNESDHDIVSVETGILVTGFSGGIVESGSKDTYTRTIQSGKSATIKPKLSLRVDGSLREGGIYMRFEDSSGAKAEKMICSYTEYLAGHSKVTVTNDDIVVEQDCY